MDSNHKLTITAFENTGAGYFTLRLIDSDGDVSSTESVQVEVVEPASGETAWLTWAAASILLILVVILLMAAARRRGEAAKGPKPKPKPRPVAAIAKPEEPEEEPVEDKDGTQEDVPPEVVPGKIRELLVIHETTSLITQIPGDKEHRLSDDKEDELIEMSTLFAEDRFDDTKVGTIKAFKFNGEEVLVGKGMNYFLAARCSGTDFDEVAHEMKRSIVNIDVNLAETLRKWYPGQKVTPLEEELRELMRGGGA
jgi:hypothetical protein